MNNGKHRTGESVGMDLINQHCESILRVLGTQNMTLVDLSRCRKRFHHLSNMFQSVINRTQEEIMRGLKGLKVEADNANKK